MFLEVTLECKSCATVSTNEWSLAQVNIIHMTLQMSALSEELPAGGALERLLPKMDGLVVTLHITLVAKDLAARRVTACKLLAQMRLAIVSHHHTCARKWLVACRARELASHEPLLVASIKRCP